jgi:hypothetical protein
MIVSLQQLKVAFNNIVPHMVKAHEFAVGLFADKRLPRHFTFEGQQDANYKPLSPRYARQKARKYGIKPILVASGKLKRGIKNWKVVRNGKSVLLNVKYPRYGAYQRQQGRDFLVLTPRDKRYVIHMLRRRYSTIRKRPFTLK